MDACKRGHNKPGWPCHAVVALDNEKWVMPVCEGLSIAEFIDTHAFLLESCKLFKTRWDPKNIHTMFANQAMTDCLLIILNIQDTCLLHGDCHHLLNKVTSVNEMMNLACMLLFISTHIWKVNLTKKINWLKKMTLSPPQSCPMWSCWASARGISGSSTMTLHMDNFHCTLNELIWRAESGCNANVTFGTVIKEHP